MNAVSTKQAIRIVQILLSSSTPLVQDGVWGPLTSDAYNKVAGDDKARLDAVIYVTTGRSVESLRGEQTSSLADNLLLESSGVAPEALRSDLQGLSDNPPWEELVRTGNSSVREIRDLIKTLASQEGVPVNTALKFFWIESKFNQHAISPSGAKGVGQLTTVAIRDVAERTGYVLKNVFDPVDNITCSLKYMKLVADYLGVGLSDPVALYAGYNIGIGNAKHLLDGNPQLANAKVVRAQGFGSPSNYLDNVARKMETMST